MSWPTPTRRARMRPKRYLDVEELRRQGIDVISTVNVQHLERMTGIVGSITGVGVRETIPDEVLDEADEVLLVDLPVSALIDRLEAGKIYPGARADQALTGFFQEGNLTALRELALRRTAEGVDDRLSDLMLTHGDALVAASDRILVLVDADERWGSALRAAWRLASAMRGDVLAVVLAPEGSLEFVEAGQRQVIGQNLSLAEDLRRRSPGWHPRDRVPAMTSPRRWRGWSGRSGYRWWCWASHCATDAAPASGAPPRRPTWPRP